MFCDSLNTDEITIQIGLKNDGILKSRKRQNRTFYRTIKNKGNVK